jgi:glycosyltransferase involved in cell wall biosynthesis
MLRGLRISVVIPCYNEARGIRAVLGAIPDYVDEVVVVDNNSTDGTGELARALGAQVVHEPRQGYGAAYKAGLPAATGDVVATLDGDNTYPAAEIRRLVELLEDRGIDFISAARFPLSDPHAMSRLNRIGNRVLTLATRVLFGWQIRDSQSGMWVFRRAVLPKLRLTSDGMAFSEEIKIEARPHPDVRFAEFPVPYAQRIGEVKLQRWRDGWENLAFLVRKRFGKVG